MKSERMTLMVSPEDKAAMSKKAESLGVTVSELIRRAVRVYDPEFEGTDFAALVAELGHVVDASDARLDASLAKLAEFEAFFARDDETPEADAIAKRSAAG